MIGINSLENGDSREFWAGAREGKLLFQRCLACGEVQFPPRRQCVTCWSEQLESLQSSGRGIVESLTIVRRAPAQAFRSKVPYVVAAIAVEEGPRMITNLLGEGALMAKAGDRVQVDFQPDDAGNVLPRFRLAEPPPEA